MKKGSDLKSAGAMYCPICKCSFQNRLVLNVHITDCSVSDSLDALVARRPSGVEMLEALAQMGQDARTFRLALEYRSRSKEERKAMRFCGKCHAMREEDDLSSSCAYCNGSDTIRSIDDFDEQRSIESEHSHRLH